MKRNEKGERLIREFLEDPDGFIEAEKNYDLLNEYHKGLSLETLRALLNSDEPLIRQEAVWIASELDEDARSLIDDVVPFLNDRHLETRLYALVAVAGFAAYEHAEKYRYVIRALESEVKELRLHAIRLISVADDEQLRSTVKFLNGDRPGDKTHREGINVLLGDEYDPRSARRMIDSDNSITRKYGAVIATRLQKKYPELIEYLLTSSDSDLNKYAETKLEAEKQFEELMRTFE